MLLLILHILKNINNYIYFSYDEAIELDPKYNYALNNKVTALNYLGRY